MKQLTCNVPFCLNDRHKAHRFCPIHRWEKDKYKIKTYKELLPIWAIKRCKIHGLLRPSETYNNRANKMIYCKKCLSDKRPKYSPEYYRECHKKYFNRSKEWQLKRKYGITIDKYNEMLCSQNNKCAICKIDHARIVNGRLMTLHVDHCHKSGKIRGLLCFKCNSILGKFNDDKSLFQNAINYLAHHQDGLR